MKYKITDADSFHIKVEYEDGSWAKIATEAGMSAKAYALAINAYRPKTGVSTDTLPVKVGDEGTVGEVPQDPYDGEAIIGYEQAREETYPTYDQQLEAAHQAREGDDTMQKGIDVNIKLVKAKFPIGGTKLTWDQFVAAKAEVMSDASWYNEAG